MSIDESQVERVARAMFDADAEAYGWVPSYYDYGSTAHRYRRHAAAAIAADPSPAEEAVKRVEALIDPAAWGAAGRHNGDRLFSEKDIRAALASPAPAPQGETCAMCGAADHREWAH